MQIAAVHESVPGTGVLLDVNVISRDVLTMVDADLPAQRVSVSAELREGRWKRWARRARIRRPGIDAAGRHGRRRRRELLAPRPIPESRGCSTAAAGWAASSIYYQTTVSAGSDVALARELQIGRIPANLTASLNASLNATGDLGLFVPTYVFATPVPGGQAAASLMTVYGTTDASLSGTLTGALTLPSGVTVPFGPRSESISNSAWGFGDLMPQFSLRWNAGVNNYMTYVTGDIPVGVYSSSSLANIGIGRGAIDAGGGYTYFNPMTGHEFSAVLGSTYNFQNQSSQYQNGVDLYLDWGASQFLTQQVQTGVVGYVYKEVGCDSGTGDRVGCFQSQVLGIGPQLGYIVPVGGMQGYLNFKSYEEFDASDRPKGWNAWVTFGSRRPQLLRRQHQRNG
jgi:hypothetical protein